jgi:T-complex protein 1 subunit eta
VGDGTTSVTLLAAEMLKEVKQFIEDGVSPQIIIKGFRTAAMLAVNRVKELAVQVDRKNERYFLGAKRMCQAKARIES